MGNAGAATAWQDGATGRGVTVGVVDSGIQMNQPDLAANISPLSTDIVPNRNQREGDDNHGTFVSGVIAAAFNGFGTVGVAYDATILSIRADVSDCNDPDDTVCFRSSDLARALDFATANGAKIINLSLGGEGRLGAAFESALQRAIASGVVFAIASGNDAEANPSWPGRYASDPRFAGGIIVVGAHDQTNQAADFSNRAGVSASAFLSAPGVDIISVCDGATCLQGSGTSFAAPAVAGALALLLEAFPNLTGREAVEILLRTARDAGDPGVDITFGRGLLDIAQAFQPVGTTQAPMALGAPVTVTVEPGSHVGGPFGDALLGAAGLQTIGHDEYQRLFRIDLSAPYGPAPRRSHQPETSRPMRQARVGLQGPEGARLSLIAATPVEEPEAVVSRFTPFDAPWLGAETRREALVDVTAGRLSFAAWQGQGGARSPFRTGAGDGFAALAQADHALRGALGLGRFTLSAESGAGDRRAPLRPVERDASTYGRAVIDWRGEHGGLAFAAGTLDERMGPLGAYTPMRSDFALPSRTRFASVGADYRLSSSLALMGEVGFGRTELHGRFLNLDGPAISSTWRLALVQDCSSWILGCRRLTWEVSQPLRVERGTFSALLADIPLEYFDPVAFSERRFSASPSGRQVDLALRSLHDLPGGSSLQLEALAIRQEQHRRDVPMGYALLASWRRGF